MKSVNTSASSDYLSPTNIAKGQSRAFYPYSEILRRLTLRVCLSWSLLPFETCPIASTSAHISHIDIEKDQQAPSISHFSRKTFEHCNVLLQQGLGWSINQSGSCSKEIYGKMVDRATSISCTTSRLPSPTTVGHDFEKWLKLYKES